MRRLLLVVAALAVGGLVAYRWRTLDHWEQAMGIGRHGSGRGGAC